VIRLQDETAARRPERGAGGPQLGELRRGRPFRRRRLGLWGRNKEVRIKGGCERDAQNLFYLDAPDQYMDHGSSSTSRWRSAPATRWTSRTPSGRSGRSTPTPTAPRLRAVRLRGCADPNRTNNTPIPESILSVLDSPKFLGTIPADVQAMPNTTASAPVFSANFTIQMGDPISGLIKAEMILGVSAKKAGKPVEAIAIYRTKLNAQESALFYSTDFPTGGTSGGRAASPTTTGTTTKRSRIRLTPTTGSRP